VGISRNRASEIVGNTNFGNIDNLFSQGRDMEYIARHYNMDLPLVWGLRIWDQWNFNECLPREIFTPLNLSGRGGRPHESK